MPNASVSFTVTCSNNSSIKKWSWFSSFFYHLLPFFSPVRLSYQQLLKSTCHPYKICSIKAYATSTDFKSLMKKKKNKAHLRERIFLLRQKDQTKNFSPFWSKRPFDYRKEFLKNSKFHFKGFHFKSTLSGYFDKVWWKNRNHTEIRNPSEVYLEPNQSSMVEPFRINS